MSVLFMSGFDIKSLPDEELATRFATTRDNACFEELVRRFWRRLCAIAYKILGDVAKAEDVAQESLLLLSMAGDRFQGRSVAGWLSVVARSLALNLRKRWLRQEEVEERFAEESLQSSPAVTPPDPEILATLATLTSEQRVCFNLFFVEGLSYKEIAERTGFTLRDVKTHIQNGRKKFKLRWKKQERHGG